MAKQKYSVSLEMGFHVELEVRADTPEAAVEEGRKTLAEAQGAQELLKLCQEGELSNWNGYLRGVWSHKTMLDQE